jgi:hypothetical protein
MKANLDNAVKIIGMVTFQVLWMALVLTAGSLWSLAAAVGTVVITVLQLAIASPPLGPGLLFLVLGGALGTALDTVMTAAGVIDPVRLILPYPVTPLWLIGLWVAFAGFLKVSLTYLRDRPRLQWVLGVLGGPLAYWSGARFGAVALHPNQPLALACLGLAWGGVCVLLFALLERLER